MITAMKWGNEKQPFSFIILLLVIIIPISKSGLFTFIGGYFPDMHSLKTSLLFTSLIQSGTATTVIFFKHNPGSPVIQVTNNTLIQN